eukprot:scaffold31044_cov112-Isochrysis_galbana.AAC.1
MCGVDIGHAARRRTRLAERSFTPHHDQDLMCHVSVLILRRCWRDRGVVNKAPGGTRPTAVYDKTRRGPKAKRA